jgi:hypothetical protein
VSGTAPLAVLFDATGTTAASGIDPFRQITYSFNFGDERGETWAVDGAAKNTQVGGPIAAHVFNTPGTFTATVTTADGSTASVQVVVADPASVYAGTKTVCVSPAKNYTGCPAGATQASAYPALPWSGKRVLLHAGESFGAIGLEDGNAGVQVGSYGTGAKPTVASVGVGDWRPATTAFATDITVMDLNVTGGITQSIGNRVLFLRNTVAAASGGVAMSLGSEAYWALSDPYRKVASSAFYNAREIFYVENVAIGPTVTSWQYGIYGSGSRVALMGNRVGKQVYHSIRITSLNKGFIAHNEMQGISQDGTYHALKLHSDGLLPYADSFIGPTDGVSGWASSQIVVANNLIGNAADNNPWTAAICPQNDQYAEGIKDVMIENNRFVKGVGTQTNLVLGGSNLTYRGNTVTNGSALSQSIGHTGALPAAWKGPYYDSAL